MSRDSSAVLLTAAGLLALALGLFGAVLGVRQVALTGLVAGSVPLAVAACSRRFRSRKSTAFPTALLAVLAAGAVVFAVAAGFSPDGVFTWGAIVSFVFVFGTGVAYPLGVARTVRQRWIAVAALAVLGELFVAAAVLDSNTHLESEGIATLLALAIVPVAVVIAVVLYRHGASLRRRFHGEGEPARRPLVVAAALPWVAGVLALVVPAALDAGLLGLRLRLTGSAGFFGLPVWLPSPAFVGFAAVGALFVAAVRRATSPES